MIKMDNQHVSVSTHSNDLHSRSMSFTFKISFQRFVLGSFHSIKHPNAIHNKRLYCTL